MIESGASRDGGPPVAKGHLLHWRCLIVLAFVLFVTFAAIAWISPQFTQGTVGSDRPILLTLTLFGIAFGFYLLATWIASRMVQSKGLVWFLVVAAVSFRAVMLFSTPIQEVDIHRYIWDGVVASQGISPFRYSPDQVWSATNSDGLEPELRRLVELRDQDPALKSLLDQLHRHFGYLPTVYPTTSQVVFAASAWSTPAGSTLLTRIRIMKAWLMLFDVGTIFVMIGLLRLCGKAPGLVTAYAWCPLVLKEVGNSGHLDAIAVFFTTLAIYGLVREIIVWRNEKAPSQSWSTVRLMITSACLCLAVGAKLYPVVLVPLFALVSFRKFGIGKTMAAAAVMVAGVGALLWPMLVSERSSAQISSKSSTVDMRENDPSQGITAFLKQWEMNDFLFMIIVENLKTPPPTAGEVAPPKVWFSVVPESSRIQWIESASRWMGTSLEETPFLLTRLITSVLFLVTVLIVAWMASSKDDPNRVPNAAFLILAWFWLLSPTQNPWYWLWVLPCLPWVKNRAWYAMSGIVFIYYLRFWLSYHYTGTEVAGTRYQGTVYFDFVVTWFEFGPWMFWLAIEGAFALFQRQGPRSESRPGKANETT